MKNVTFFEPVSSEVVSLLVDVCIPVVIFHGDRSWWEWGDAGLDKVYGISAGTSSSSLIGLGRRGQHQTASWFLAEFGPFESSVGNTGS